MDLIEMIRDAGVVGCGGAGFPTHVKLDSKVAPDVFIVNGAECEPLLRTDRYLMIHEADKLVEGVDLICRERQIPRAVIALKKSYKEEIRSLEEAIKRSGSNIEIHPMESFYPAGDEQVIVYEVTGKTVPPSGIPLDVGAIVDNVATVIAVCDAAKGIPFTDKYVTVTGEVNSPSVVKVPVGTSIEHCIELAGGLKTKDVCVVMGGPMMGLILSYEDALKAQVKKTTNGIIVLPEGSDVDRRRVTRVEHILNRAGSSCIQCSFCTQMCPRYLLGHPLEPHRIMRKMATCTDISEMLEDKDIKNAALCSECGVCEIYACPMGLSPRVVNGVIKGELAKAGIRYSRSDKEWTANEDRQYRLAPTSRVAVRAGVGSYYHIEGHSFVCDETPDRVVLPLKMHIGAPSIPAVKTGETVKKGQLVASCPDKALGANLHASISGLVTLENDAIIITSEV